jgi:four helix bundle protein
MLEKPFAAFMDLIVWQKGHQFVLNVYRSTKGFPPIEMSGFTAQFREAAVKICAKISEAYFQSDKVEKLKLLNISQCSLEECKYYLILARDLKYEVVYDMPEQIEEVGRLLSGYIKSIKEKGVRD